MNSMEQDFIQRFERDVGIHAVAAAFEWSRVDDGAAPTGGHRDYGHKLSVRLIAGGVYAESVLAVGGFEGSLIPFRAASLIADLYRAASEHPEIVATGGGHE